MINLAKSTFTNEGEVLRQLQENYSAYESYMKMDDEWKSRFMDFCTGKKTLPVMYEPFFKRIFHPDVHVDRLSGVISSIIGEEVRVCKVLPLEDPFIDGGRMVVMDILVEAIDGSLANVEIQKSPYLFPGERISCYSSDIVLRQYSKVKGERGKDFAYKDLRKVYTIVIYEKTEAIFHKLPDHYIHRGKVVFDTGLKLELLQEYYLVALDVFRNISYDNNEDKSELTGWLSFLITESLEDAEKLMGKYPWLQEIYREIASYREKPEETLMMFSQMLREMDRNTMQYMIDEQKKEIEEKDKKIEEKDAEIARLKRLLEEK